MINPPPSNPMCTDRLRFHADLFYYCRTMKDTEIKTLDAMVQHSIRQHIDLIDLLWPLQQQLESPSLDAITKFNTVFSTLQQEIEIFDRELEKQLKMATIPDHIEQLLDRRQSLQQEILHVLKHTVPKACSVKSLMASEIQSVKNGRKALNGYKTQSENQGRIVNRIS